MRHAGFWGPGEYSANSLSLCRGRHALAQIDLDKVEVSSGRWLGQWRGALGGITGQK